MRRVYTPGACVATSSSDYFRSGERRYFAEDTGREIDENAEFSFKFSSAVRRAFFFFFFLSFCSPRSVDSSRDRDN